MGGGRDRWMRVEDGMSRDETKQALAELHDGSYGWALACCGFDREEAAEVLQTCYMKILEGRARFNGRSSVKTWFFGVVRRTAAERRRRRLVRGSALRRWFEGRPASAAADTPESLSADAEQAVRLRGMLARLSPRQRKLLHLVFYQELTIGEAAEVLGVSVGTARVHYERGKAQLRKLLSDAESDDASERRSRSGNQAAVRDVS